MLEPSHDFAALLVRAKQGDQAALTELVRRYEPDLRIVVRARLGQALRPYLDSMDVVNSVHHVLIRGLRNDQFQVDSPVRLLGLLATLVRNKIARHWRKLRRQQRLDGSSVNAGGIEQVLMALSDSTDDPARTAALRDAVERICRDLDPIDRRLLELRIEGYTTAEAAVLMNRDAGVLRVRLQRLRQRLAEQGIDPHFL